MRLRDACGTTVTGSTALSDVDRLLGPSYALPVTMNSY